MAAGDSHKTSIAGLVQQFRRALDQLIPVFQEAGLAWRRGEAYDQWDSVSEVLHRVLIEEPIAWALGEVDHLRLPPYGFLTGSYRDVSFIEVMSGPGGAPGPLLALRSLETESDSIDSVDAVAVGDDLQSLEGDQRIPIGEARFRLHWLRPDGMHQVVEDLVIPR